MKKVLQIMFTFIFITIGLNSSLTYASDTETLASESEGAPAAADVENIRREFCENCGPTAKRGGGRCEKCNTYYCSSECQKADWQKGHRQLCQAIVNYRARRANEKNQNQPEATAQVNSQSEVKEGESQTPSRPCAKCNGDGATKKCSKCKKVFYCSRDHQVADWPTHKLLCGKDSNAVPAGEPRGEAAQASLPISQLSSEEKTLPSNQLVLLESHPEPRYRKVQPIQFQFQMGTNAISNREQIATVDKDTKNNKYILSIFDMNRLQSRLRNLDPAQSCGTEYKAPMDTKPKALVWTAGDDPRLLVMQGHQILSCKSKDNGFKSEFRIVFDPTLEASHVLAANPVYPNQVLVGTTNREILLYDLETGNTKNRIIHPQEVGSAIWSPGNPYNFGVIAGDQYFQYDTRQELKRIYDLKLRSARDGILSQAFGPKGNHDIFLGYKNGEISRFDLTAMKPVEYQKDLCLGEVRSLLYNGRTERLVASGTGNISVWQLSPWVSSRAERNSGHIAHLWSPFKSNHSIETEAHWVGNDELLSFSSDGHLHYFSDWKSR